MAKLRFNKKYIRIATKQTEPRLEYNVHHLLPNEFFEDGPTITLPYDLHNSLHKNFNNHKLMLDPIGCLIKCIDQRMPADRGPKL